MKKSLFTIILSVFFTYSFAQGETWSLERCMQYAIANSPSAKRQQYSNDNYKQDYINAIANMLPSISGSVSATPNFGRSINDDNVYVNNSSFNNAYSLSASMPIFNGFATINAVRSSKIGRLLGKEYQQQVYDDISLSVMERYFNVILYMGLVTIAEEQLQESGQNLFKARELEKLGLRSSADVAQVEAQVATNDANLINQQNNLTNAWTLLKNVMNYPLEDSLRIDTAINMIDDVPQESASEVFVTARTLHPSIRIADYQLRQSKLNYAMSRGRLLPSVSLSAEYHTNYYSDKQSTPAPFSYQFRNKRGGYISATLSIPIFNGLARRTNVNRNLNNLRITEQNNAETLRALQSSIKQAVDRCNGLAKEYLQAAKQVSATTLAHRAVQRKYDEGLLSSLELQTSATQVQQAKSYLLDVKLQYVIQYRLIRYYQGIPLIEQVH